MGCNEVPATTGVPTVLGGNASWYALAGSNLAVGADAITIGTTNISYSGANSFALIGNQYLTHGSINFTDVAATLANNGAGGGINGLGTHSTVAITGNNFTLTTNNNYTGFNSRGTVASYAILAGSSVDSGENIAANNGKFSTITLNNATIRQSTSTNGAFFVLAPVLNSGLRAIQGASGNSGNGSSGKIEIKGLLDMILTGSRIEGIYVSGASSDSAGNEAVSQVILNDSTIKMVKIGTVSYDSSAIKIGKARTVGTGKGLVVSNGALKIDMDPTFGGSSGYMSPAIKMAVSGSELQANGPNSSADINATRSVLAIGIDDWGTSEDSTGIKASFGKATIKTQSIPAPLLLVDSGQQDAQVLFDQNSNLTAASDGYLVDIINYRHNSTSSSSLQLNIDHRSTMTGLTNKAYTNSTLNIDLNNNSTWNLAEKTTGAVSTSTFDALTMNGGSKLNATTPRTAPANFILKGDVTSTLSTLNLADGKAGDVLTIQGNYKGNNGNLVLDTVLGDDSSLTDKLVITGNASGTTTVTVNNANGSGASTLEGIEVIDTGSSTSNAFVQSGRIVAGAHDYSLVRGAGSNINNWYLSSMVTPTPEPTPEPKPVQTWRPELSSYTANLAAANTLFSTRLHDRLGETQYTDVLTGEKKVTSMWMRNVGGHSQFTMNDGQNKTTANRYVLQIGGDVAQWSSDGLNRLHLGVMGGYANQRSSTKNNLTGYRSKGSIDGYSAGLYGTWYQNDADKTGLYVDTWALYNWFDNDVTGDGLSAESYRSKGMTASVESGYTFHVGSQTTDKGMTNDFYLQPKMQLTWSGVKADDHTEVNGTRVQGSGNDNLQARIGTRFYLKGKSALDRDTQREFEPFVEANWIYNSRQYGTQMDGAGAAIQGSRNTGEVKAGVEGRLTNNLNIWTSVGHQMGGDSYRDTQGQLGLKYLF